jgi:hypothetical protein
LSLPIKVQIFSSAPCSDILCDTKFLTHNKQQVRLWDDYSVMPYSLADKYQHFGSLCCLHLYGRKMCRYLSPKVHGVTFQRTVILTFIQCHENCNSHMANVVVLYILIFTFVDVRWEDERF